MNAVDAVIGAPRTPVGGTFGVIHTRAVEAIALNMGRTLEAAINQAGDNIEQVFERADAIDGALRNDRPSPGPVPFIGRRLNDPYRKLALETVAQGVVNLETRRQVSAHLARRLISEGVTDAVTGFIDRSGRRWPLDVYTEMVARTTTREAMTRATVNRLLEGDNPIVTIDSHEHKADVCSPYDGQTYALTTTAATKHGLPVLDRLPPFHPRCKHVATPGTGNLEAFERELGLAVAEERRQAVTFTTGGVIRRIPT